MRNVTYEDQEFEVRALKRKHIRDLNKKGLPLENVPRERADECMDEVFKTVFEKDELKKIDELEYHNAMALFKDVIKETYGARDEEKNSLRSGNGEQTKVE